MSKILSPEDKIKLGERIRDLREGKNISQSDFAKALGGKTKQTVYNWEQGNTSPNNETIGLMREKFGFNPEYLKREIGPKYLDEPKPPGVSKKASQLGSVSKRAFDSPQSTIIEYDEDPVTKLVVNPLIDYVNSDFVKLAVFKRTGAGNEMVGVEYEQIDTVVIPKKLYGAHLIPFKVSGESMEKLIMEDSIVLVDTSPHDDIEEGRIYCFRIPYRGFIIRKVEKSPDGLYLIPYNKTFQTRRIAWEEFNPEWVIGRVMWNIINPVGF